jgi:hypothetical protein
VKAAGFAYCLIAVLACATATNTGPRVSEAESRAAQRFLEVRSIQRILAQQYRLDVIANNLVSALPDSLGRTVRPYLGIRIAEPGGATELLTEAIRAKRPAHPFLYSLDPTGPAASAGLQLGDQILAVDTVKILHAEDLARYFALSAAPQYAVTIRRDTVTDTLLVFPANRVLGLSAVVIPSKDANAFATEEGILVSSSMLTLLDNDDELAVILGHEMAHILRGHLKKQSSNVLKATLGILVAAVAAELIEPGVGNGQAVADIGNYVGKGIITSFSRDFEREADRFGLEYAARAGYNPEAGFALWERLAMDAPEQATLALFATHPSSPERLVRAKTIAERLRAGEPLDDLDNAVPSDLETESATVQDLIEYSESLERHENKNDRPNDEAAYVATQVSQPKATDVEQLERSIQSLRAELELSKDELDALHRQIVRIREDADLGIVTSVDEYAYPKLVERQNVLADSHNAKVDAYKELLRQLGEIKTINK